MTAETTMAEATTVAATLLRAAERFGNRAAIQLEGKSYTHAAVLSEAQRYARALAGHGLKAGDHVGILMPNCIEYLWLFYGCALIGVRPVHLNARYKRDELRYVVADSDIRWLFTSHLQSEYVGFQSLLKEAFPTLADWQSGAQLQLAEAPLLRGVFLFHGDGDRWPNEDAFLQRSVAVDPVVSTDPEQIALIMYTSGTTAHPKACLLSHRAVEFTGHAMMRRWQITADDRIWDPLPFFHMSSMLPLAACRASGATFQGMLRFDGDAAMRQIIDGESTILFAAFPAITNELLAHPRFGANNLAKARIMNNVGPPELLRRFHVALPNVTHVSAYGLTEGGGVVAFHELLDSADDRAETCGRPFEGAEVRVVDPDTLAVLPAETRGELQLKGPLLFSGYYKDEAKTLATLRPDGWLRTGDLGALTKEGRIRYLGRIKDMLKVGGENVAAIEIEGHLSTHPAIKVAQVIAAADERLQEVPAAFVELQAGASMSAEDVIRHCVGRIASFKVPRYVVFVTEWPMSATKIQKFALREQLKGAVKYEPSRFRS